MRSCDAGTCPLLTTRGGLRAAGYFDLAAFLVHNAQMFAAGDVLSGLECWHATPKSLLIVNAFGCLERQPWSCSALPERVATVQMADSCCGLVIRLTLQSAKAGSSNTSTRPLLAPDPTTSLPTTHNTLHPRGLGLRARALCNGNQPQQVRCAGFVGKLGAHRGRPYRLQRHQIQGPGSVGRRLHGSAV